MSGLPEYIGPAAFGLKMGVVVPGSDVVEMVLESVARFDRDGLLADRDIICITESVVARAQGNFVTTGQIANEVREKLNLSPTSTLGILWPITSRNRFSMILRGLAEAVPKGKVVIQLPYPDDEVGNQVVPREFVESLGKDSQDIITYDEFKDRGFLHPITKVSYPKLYIEVVTKTGAEPVLYLCNDPQRIADFAPDGVVVANVHGREGTRTLVSRVVENSITLQDICSSWSEWGLMGSNMSSGDKLKLAPRNSNQVVRSIQQQVLQKFGKRVEVLIYGDGAYKDPTTGIYEMADPQPAFGTTDGFRGTFRKGVKYKYLADRYLDEGKSKDEIESLLNSHHGQAYADDDVLSEGTTPRKMEDLVASLADLVSGSADAGTPVVVVKGFFSR